MRRCVKAHRAARGLCKAGSLRWLCKAASLRWLCKAASLRWLCKAASLRAVAVAVAPVGAARAWRPGERDGRVPDARSVEICGDLWRSGEIW